MKEKLDSYLRYAKFRDKLNMTDLQVARQSGVDSATIYSWKAGAYTPKLDKMLKISKVLNISLEQLVGA